MRIKKQVWQKPNHCKLILSCSSKSIKYLFQSGRKSMQLTETVCNGTQHKTESIITQDVFKPPHTLQKASRWG